MSDAVPLRLMLFTPEEMAKGFDVVGLYKRSGSAYQILLSDGDDLTLVFGELLPAAMKDHQLHDGSSDLSSVTVRRRPQEFVFVCETPDNQAITDYVKRVAPLLTQSMDIVSPPDETARELFAIAASDTGLADWHPSLQNSMVGNLIAAIRLGEPCQVTVEGTMIQGVGVKMQDHQMLISLRQFIASVEDDGPEEDD